MVSSSSASAASASAENLSTSRQASGEQPAGFPDRSQIEEQQLRKLRALREAIVPANPFYSQQLAGVGPDAFQSLEQFAASVPFTTRHELVRDRIEHPPYGSNLTFPLESYVRCHQTSGTTTVPMRWLDTPETWSHIVENWVQIFQAAGITRQDRFFFAFSFGPFLGFWSALEAVLKTGCFCFPGGSMSSLARLHAILDNGITVLCCTPTYAQHLGEVAREKQVDLSKSRLRLIIVAGEAGGSIPAIRSRIESHWRGARVFDHHGMTEVGPVTYQCPSRPGCLHVLESAYLPEVVEPASGKPIPPNETGELVLTTLDRIGSPLLRYRTGDLVKAEAPGRCACGRHERTFEGGILGRSDDMVVIRGVNVYPALVEEIVRRFAQISEYRVHLYLTNAMPEISLQIETVPGEKGSQGSAAMVQEALKTMLNLRIPVTEVPPGSLPRFEMKAQRWVRVEAGSPFREKKPDKEG